MVPVHPRYDLILRWLGFEHSAAVPSPMHVATAWVESAKKQLSKSIPVSAMPTTCPAPVMPRSHMGVPTESPLCADWCPHWLRRNTSLRGSSHATVSFLASHLATERSFPTSTVTRHLRADVTSMTTSAPVSARIAATHPANSALSSVGSSSRVIIISMSCFVRLSPSLCLKASLWCAASSDSILRAPVWCASPVTVRTGDVFDAGGPHALVFFGEELSRSVVCSFISSGW
mmetsp:Transcript_52433/g.124869  ORF Transcript_52433/g.124869 Transcript_52433/m.124869 type:complete len:231 (+) Transcript_52433:2368-3060(+)